ncbi:MAG TPA: MarR family winged helix-turn-helix transcriptional regulator, partial [Acidimicrobiales bacterium]|nr:MarR family winged helix-turn-helix transcriptional regulator [Acidimicrobiales bacterium]
MAGTTPDKAPRTTRAETSVTSDLGALPHLMIRALKAMIADLAARNDDPQPPAHGLTAVHGIAARYIEANDDVTVVELAAHLRVTKQSASEIVAALEREGGVVRRPHPADGRARVIELTDLGREGLVESRKRWGELIA